MSIGRFSKFVTIVLALGCSKPSPPPASKAATLDEAAARLSQISGKPIRPFATRDFGREENPAARSVLVADADAADIVTAVRRELGPGLLAFIGCRSSLAEPHVDGCEVVVAEGENQFDILRVAQSDAANYGLQTEDLVRKLKEYDAKYGIDIFHAETDTIEFQFRNVPRDLAPFCLDLYKFCPDIVDQGTETVEQLEKAVAETGTVFLWWD